MWHVPCSARVMELPLALLPCLLQIFSKKPPSLECAGRGEEAEISLGKQKSAVPVVGSIGYKCWFPWYFKKYIRLDSFLACMLTWR